MRPTDFRHLRREACWGFFRPKYPTVSGRCEPKASTLPLDHRSRLLAGSLLTRLSLHITYNYFLYAIDFYLPKFFSLFRTIHFFECQHNLRQEAKGVYFFPCATFSPMNKLENLFSLRLLYWSKCTRRCTHFHPCTHNGWGRLVECPLQ
jgi:hypothetical protein